MTNEQRLFTIYLGRNPYPEPCQDCGRTYLQGENVSWEVPDSNANEYRIVWSGCADCWIKRTNPGIREEQANG